MTEKHVFNNSDGLVVKSMRGAVALNPVLRLHTASKSVYNSERSDTICAAVISGGGAGHEPAHAGYTGRGLLSACVSGDIFASPSATHILTCIKLAIAVQKTSNVLLVINNYTGDRLNFGLAAERAKAEIPGIAIESIVVADDVSLTSQPSLVGARGLAGNILVCKILGAAAEAGRSLKELKVFGDALVGCLSSVGVGLEHCHVPGRELGSERMKVEECELGLGLHNEPGVRRMKLKSPQVLIGEMLAQIWDSAKTSPEASLRPGNEVVLFVNNLGGMSILEMGAVVDEVLLQLSVKDIHPVRILSASYMTSLNAPGFSISLLDVSAICEGLPSQISVVAPILKTVEGIISLIDAPTDASAWTGVRTHLPELGTHRDLEREDEETEALLSVHINLPSASSIVDPQVSSCTWSDLGISEVKVEKAIREACAAVLEAERDLTRFDTVLGDGDCGETFASGARAVLKAMDACQLNTRSLAQLTARLADLLVDSMGGTSGAIFGLYFTALSAALSSSSAPKSAPLQALEALSSYTPARPGDRTLVDALHPFCVALDSGHSFTHAVQEARNGAESTRNMRPRLGRAVYIGVDDDSEKDLPPDPGAWGLKGIFGGLEKGLASK